MTTQPEALRLADQLAALDAQLSYPSLCGELAAELRRLAAVEAERDALVRKMSGYIVDAARYRWLRDFSPIFEFLRKTKENIDAAIDAARGKT